MPNIKTKTTYLEMRSPPASRIEPPCEGIEIVWAKSPSRVDYLAWYKAVGEAWLWTDRLQMEPARLQALLDDPGVVVHLLLVDRHPAGFVEIDGRESDEIEIKYFGLFPTFIGRGLGKYFLNAIAHQVWQHGPKRLWLHTCDLDHTAALPNYLKAGFEIFDEKFVDKVIP
ncbi:MAG: GNAT family N-acetyltransferase [Pirellulaceae bacterium]|jgi:GNAT superfamily N-acetyltransferase|nr:GNAT family N-acetyltransferase [Pirellulaceae bacterium]